MKVVHKKPSLLSRYLADLATRSLTHGCSAVEHKYQGDGWDASGPAVVPTFAIVGIRQDSPGLFSLFPRSFKKRMKIDFGSFWIILGDGIPFMTFEILQKKNIPRFLLSKIRLTQIGSRTRSTPLRLSSIHHVPWWPVPPSPGRCEAMGTLSHWML